MGVKRIFSSSGALGKKVFSGGGPFFGKGLGNASASEQRQDDEVKIAEATQSYKAAMGYMGIGFPEAVKRGYEDDLKNSSLSELDRKIIEKNIETIDEHLGRQDGP